MAKKVLKQNKDTPPKICYFCLWNDPVMEIYKGKQILPTCRYCASVMQPLVNTEESGVWGWHIAQLRPIHPDAIPFQKMPFLKCPNCSFKTVHQISLDHHQKYSHRIGHDFPPNIVPEIEKQDWIKKVGRRW